MGLETASVLTHGHLQHEGSIEHVLQREIEASVEVLIGELSQKPDVVQAVGHGRDLLQAYVCRTRQERLTLGILCSQSARTRVCLILP